MNNTSLRVIYQVLSPLFDGVDRGSQYIAVSYMSAILHNIIFLVTHEEWHCKRENDGLLVYEHPATHVMVVVAEKDPLHRPVVIMCSNPLVDSELDTYSILYTSDTDSILILLNGLFFFSLSDFDAHLGDNHFYLS